jgi:hypothetical protein
MNFCCWALHKLGKHSSLSCVPGPTHHLLLITLLFLDYILCFESFLGKLQSLPDKVIKAHNDLCDQIIKKIDDLFKEEWITTFFD